MLPFGLTSAPLVFTKVMAVVAAHLQRLGISVFPYLDDRPLKAGSPQSVVDHLQMTANLLTCLEFSINVPKSHLRLLFIGAIFNAVLFQAFGPAQRVQDIQVMISMLDRKSVCRERV